jgi:hypothetical protein
MGPRDEASAGGTDAKGFGTLANAQPIGAAIEHTTTLTEAPPC